MTVALKMMMVVDILLQLMTINCGMLLKQIHTKQCKVVAEKYFDIKKAR